MNNLSKCILLALTLIQSYTLNAFMLDENYVAKWAGIEVIGVEQEKANEIRKLIPIEMGSSLKVSDSDSMQVMLTALIKEKTLIDNVICSMLYYGDKEVYLIVDIYAPENIEHIYRSIPNKTGSHAKMPKILNKLYAKKGKRELELVSSGSFPIENDRTEFIDYEDPKLHSIAKKLSYHANKYNNTLLDIVRYSKDPQERRKAAELLSWARHPENLTSILAWNLLFDPDRGVRNYVARSHTNLITKLKNKIILNKLFPVYCKQAAIPSHTDRNKALYSMREILKASPDVAQAMDAECKKIVTHISEASILENVGGVAKEILQIMESAPNA